MIEARPHVIVRAAGTDDVVLAVRYAADTGRAVAVRGGGHSVPGFGTADDAVVVDLSPMQAVDVDPGVRTATAGGGTTWGRFNDATAASGLATTGGIISTTGIGGLPPRGGVCLPLPRPGAGRDQPGAAAGGDARDKEEAGEGQKVEFWGAPIHLKTKN